MNKNGIQIKSFRAEHNMTQIELSRVIGITQAHLSNIEKGKRTINPDIMQVFVETGVIEAYDLTQRREGKFIIDSITDKDYSVLIPLLRRISGGVK